MNPSTEQLNAFAQQSIMKLKKSHTRKQLWHTFRGQIVTDCAEALNTKLFPKQKDIINSQYKIKIIRAARRTAKSYSTAFISYCMLHFAAMFGYPVHIKFAGPRAEDCLHIWEHLHKFLAMSPIPNLKITYNNWSNNSTHKKEIKFSVLNDGEWLAGGYVKSASCDSPDMNDIRGDNHDLVAVDEFGQIAHKELFLAAVDPSLKDLDSLNELMIVGTFDLYGTGKEFNDLFKKGQDEELPYIKSWTLKGTDNPYIDQEDAKTSDDILNAESHLREVMGEGIPAAGRMFPHMNMKTQVGTYNYNPSHPLLIGLDFGFRKPIVEFLQHIDQNVYVLNELCPKDIRIDGLVEHIKMILQLHFNGTTPLLLGCDPAGDKANDVVSFNSFDILKKAYPMSQYTRNHTLVSKSNQVRLLNTLTYQNRIFIDNKCEKLISSFAMAAPDTTKTGAINSAGWKKEKGTDDPLDALVYALINYGPTSQMLVPEEKQHVAPSDAEIQQAMARL